MPTFSPAPEGTDRDPKPYDQPLVNDFTVWFEALVEHRAHARHTKTGEALIKARREVREDALITLHVHIERFLCDGMGR
jgi:hypothetical protein